MAPPPRAGAQRAQHPATQRRVYAAHAGTVRVAHAVPMRRIHPYPVYAAVTPPPPPGYPRVIYPRYRTWQAVYPVYAYPGYGYVYYYVTPFGYRAY